MEHRREAAGLLATRDHDGSGQLGPQRPNPLNSLALRLRITCSCTVEHRYWPRPPSERANHWVQFVAARRVSSPSAVKAAHIAPRVMRPTSPFAWRPKRC